MRYEDIIRVKKGTILRTSDNRKFIVRGKLNQEEYYNPKPCVILSEYKNNQIKNSDLVLDLSNLTAIIDGNLVSKDIMKYQLLGIQFYEEVNYKDLYIDKKEIKGDSVICTKRDNIYEIIQCINDKYYMYDVMDFPYISNKRQISNSNCPEHIFGKQYSMKDLIYIKSHKSYERIIRWDTLERFFIGRIENLVSNTVNMGTSQDLMLLSLYRDKPRDIKNKLLDYLMLKADIAVVYSYYNSNKGKNSELYRYIRKNTDIEFNKYNSKLKNIVTKGYNNIIENIEIDSRKKLSTVAKELISKGKIIKGYDTRIDIEEFFDTNKYYPFEIMDWIEVL